MIYPISPINNINTTIPLNNSVGQTKAVSFGENQQQLPQAAAFVQYSSTLKTDSEKQMYADLQTALPKQKKDLEFLLKSGKLLKRSGVNGSTTLQNLHNILAKPRLEGFDNREVLGETVKFLANPFKISQKMGDFSKKDAEEVFAHLKAENKLNAPNAPKSVEQLIHKESSTCAAASMEFNIADKKPAEYARFVDGLTSPEKCVKTIIQYDDVSANTGEAKTIIEQFKVKATPLNDRNIKLELVADENAYVRARNQLNDYDNGERMAINVLMQSLIMNFSSQGSYNSLTDKHNTPFNDDDEGLVEYQKTFAETVLRNERITSIADPNGGVLLDSRSPEQVMDLILKMFAEDRNIVGGFVYKDAKNQIVAGHEITLTEAYMDKNGELYIVYNDTDDNKNKPVHVKASHFLPTLHHMGITDKILAES